MIRMPRIQRELGWTTRMPQIPRSQALMIRMLLPIARTAPPVRFLRICRQHRVVHIAADQSNRQQQHENTFPPMFFGRKGF